MPYPLSTGTGKDEPTSARKKYDKRLGHPELNGPAPPCFSEEQWDLWTAAERYLARISNGETVTAHGYCTFCTPDYKQEMMNKDKCSHTQVVFVLDPPDKSIRGVRTIRKGI